MEPVPGRRAAFDPSSVTLVRRGGRSRPVRRGHASSSAKPGSPGSRTSKLSRSPRTFGVIASTWRGAPSAMTASASAIAGQLLEVLDRSGRRARARSPAVLLEGAGGAQPAGLVDLAQIRARLAVGWREGDVEAGVEADRDHRRASPSATRDGARRPRGRPPPPRRARGPPQTRCASSSASTPRSIAGGLAVFPGRRRRPGKTQTPGMKRASAPRRSISISRPPLAVPAAAPQHDHRGRGTGRCGLIHGPSHSTLRSRRS